MHLPPEERREQACGAALRACGRLRSPSIFLASSRFASCSQAESAPAHTQVKPQTVSPSLANMKRTFVILAILLTFAALGYAFADSQNLGGVFRTATPTVTCTPTFTSTSPATNTATSTLTASPTFTNTHTLTPTSTATNTLIPPSPTKKPKDNNDGGSNDGGGSGGGDDVGCVDSCEPPGGGGD